MLVSRLDASGLLCWLGGQRFRNRRHRQPCVGQVGAGWAAYLYEACAPGAIGGGGGGADSSLTKPYTVKRMLLGTRLCRVRRALRAVALTGEESVELSPCGRAAIAVGLRRQRDPWCRADPALL